MKVLRTLLMLGIFTVLLTPDASGQLFKSWYACGGNSVSFDTCASVGLTIDGTNVSVKVQNLSGTTYDAGSGPTTTWQNTVFTGIGFEWADPSKALIAFTPQVTTMSGATVQNKDGDDPDPWVLSSNTQIGGGINLDLVGTTDNGVDDGIISDLSTIPDPTTDKKNYWLSGNSSGWVTFSFGVQAHSLTMGDLDGIGLLVKGQNGPQGQDDSLQLICGIPGEDTADLCDTTVVPEPVSMALLGTGLLGLGYVRRRRNRAKDEPNAEL